MNDIPIELSKGKFDNQFALVPNHIDPSAGWTIGDSGGCLFETFGEEFAFVHFLPGSLKSPGRWWLARMMICTSSAACISLTASATCSAAILSQKARLFRSICRTKLEEMTMNSSPMNPYTRTEQLAKCPPVDVTEAQTSSLCV